MLTQQAGRKVRQGMYHLREDVVAGTAAAQKDAERGKITERSD